MTRGILIVVAVLLVTLLIGLLGYLLINTGGVKKITDLIPEKRTKDLMDTPANPQKGDPGFEEKNTEVSTKDEGKYAGNLSTVIGGQIFITVGDEDQAYLLNDEISIQCTLQDLKGVTNADLGQVEVVKLVRKDEIKEFIPVNTPIFLLASLVNDTPTIHTVIVSSKVCEQY